jgi:hypothetical protein
MKEEIQKTKLDPLPEVGEYWKAFSKDDEDDTVWLFQIVWITKVNRQFYFLGMKCDWKTGKPLIETNEDERSQCWWFDSKGNAQAEGSDLFYLGEWIENWRDEV